ncbi:MAG: hypothetical protein CEE40_08875 [Chloroflexi bacterium B3_Chlor]|nr:MAG: hypothetical protein CEE40_08875 [Chloroflexi bacterium B3_Chlor]
MGSIVRADTELLGFQRRWVMHPRVGVRMSGERVRASAIRIQANVAGFTSIVIGVMQKDPRQV